jgi:hypothetical protein
VRGSEIERNYWGDKKRELDCAKSTNEARPIAQKYDEPLPEPNLPENPDYERANGVFDSSQKVGVFENE